MLALSAAGVALGQQTVGNCTLTSADDPTAQPGGTIAISATLGAGTVTVQAGADINGIGLLSLTKTTSTNTTVTIPAFTSGTTAPVTVTFAITNPNLAASFVLNARTEFHAINITVTCTPAPPVPPPSACVLTQGYWKNHPSAWPVQTLTLGNVPYTKAQLLSILGTPVRGNGLISLAYQLIAAKLNLADGAVAPANVQIAIAAADALIGNLVVPPVGNGSLSPSSTSGVSSILDAFNNGNAPGGPAHCDD